MADPHISPLVALNLATAAKVSQERAAVQEESEQDLNNLAATFDGASGMNAMARSRQSKTLEQLKSTTTDTEEAEESEEGAPLQTREIEDLANQSQKSNYELNARTLLILRERIHKDDNPEEILEKVNATYADPSLGDEALDFLIKSATPETKEALLKAKEDFNANYGREIKAGRNMGAQAREFSEQGLGSPDALRKLYRELTGAQREPLQLFTDLTEKFNFDKMKPAIAFLLHALGSDLKAKGPSIPPGELKKLIDDTRSLQGILGVFRFFQSRMGILMRHFLMNALLFPESINFETLAKILIKLIQERYINPDKIRYTAEQLGISEEILAQIIVYNQMREAIKQISPRYYRNTQHKDELTQSFIDLIEQLEDEFEAEEEREEEEQRKKNKKND